MVLFGESVNDDWIWFVDGNEKTDSKYVGEIRNGVPNGQGTHTTPKGNKYEGEWNDGKKDGKGMYINKNGDKYGGEFKEGKRNGKGTYTWSNGSRYVGRWKDGERWKGRQYDRNGNIMGRFLNGVKQK